MVAAKRMKVYTKQKLNN